MRSLTELLVLPAASILTFGLASALVSCQMVPTEQTNNVQPDSQLGSTLGADATDALGASRLSPIDVFIPKNLPEHVSKDMDGSRFQLSRSSFPREKVADFQIAGTDKTKTPKDLQGIWWMEGNLACSCTVSFAKVDFSLPYVYMSNFSENNFAYFGGSGPGDPNYEAGSKSFMQTVKSNSVYEFHFEGQGVSRYKKANIYPLMSIKVAGFPISMRVKPTLVKFRFTKVDDDLYLRENFILGLKVKGTGGEYRFKRILKPSSGNQDVLEKTKHWQEFVSAESSNAIVKNGPPAMQRLPELIQKRKP